MKKNISIREKNSLIIKPIIFMMVLLLLITTIILSGCSTKTTNNSNQKEAEEITILWAEWAPADYLQEISKDFTSQTGIKIKIVREPWGTFQTTFFAEMNNKSEKYDLVIGDSQWLGVSSEKGYYIELTKWIKDNNVEETMTRASMAGYAEYPKGSKKYWAIPAEGDALGFAYRKDLFEDPKEKAAFKARYNYSLDIPKTWKELKDIAEFFNRPEQEFYGVAIYTQKDYDALTSGVEQLVWAWGSDLGDYNTYKIKGYINSKEGIEALKFYKELYKYTPPNLTNAFYVETNDAFIKGKVAMAMNFFAFFPALIDARTNTLFMETGFFSNPSGPQMKASALGGQGISIISYSKNKEASLKFLEWWIKDSTQEKWADAGGYTCNKNILESEKFAKAASYNVAFRESMNNAKDFWAVPEYAQLLEISQKYLSAYLLNENITAEDTMNNIASEWETIFEYAGYYKE
jgi:multiple sugar transport system substrate-binding protein